MFVFEPVPHYIAYLKEHSRLNRADDVKVIEAAVSDSDGVISFDEGGYNVMRHLSSSGKLQAKTVALDDLFSKGEIPIPDYIKIDIEGAELLVLSGAKRMLIESHPVIFLATHGSVVHRECCCLLQSPGYQLQPIGGTEYRVILGNTCHILRKGNL